MSWGVYISGVNRLMLVYLFIFVPRSFMRHWYWCVWHWYHNYYVCMGIRMYVNLNPQQCDDYRFSSAQMNIIAFETANSSAGFVIHPGDASYCHVQLSSNLVFTSTSPKLKDVYLTAAASRIKIPTNSPVPNEGLNTCVPTCEMRTFIRKCMTHTILTKLYKGHACTHFCI